MRFSSIFLLASGVAGFSPSIQTGSRLGALSAKPKVFIDGEAGTTGIQVRSRLEKRDDLEIISPPSDLRKDPDTRKQFINEADAVILCLPDDASIEAASWVDNDRTVLIDASTAFRVADDWVYGFPELCKEQREALTTTKRISNPGCYPTGFISLTRPLTDAGIIPAGTPLTVNAISGYSGGGKGLMNLYETEEHEPWGAYGFSLKHKHIPEMAKYSGLGKEPIFQPQVADFPQGMVVNIPLHYAWLAEGTTGEKMHQTLSKHYEGSNFIEVMPMGEAGVKEAGLLERDAFLRPDTLKNTNKMQLFVFANDEAGQAVLSARLDNLGKGASGAAVQNLNIALGLDETTGL
ncbi:N-acetyl-gamma-glutamyl-phosphate reductase [Seminavis robusta]|uniref:N-acetyl-gamma-glutamyl-phosphate reductase n=1 Tax=Seminavis robusta TaxID=568900 RepID=A0A9N8HH86_9STRA|nr:N-acetyl-gamma-glutamyl-phosphate reductase [Seminavis robusta]|eukprot:Sro691_g187770.1 N-acetyl-gamma-glutamyl-phosphate reductase (349) ;mRNA; r:8988-10223